MLIAIVEAVSCETPRCSEFAKPVDLPRAVRSYYCQTCGSINRFRGVDANTLASPERYRQFLLRVAKEKPVV
jgi:hypothetical protein